MSGIRLHAVRLGAGQEQPLIVLHGWGQSSSVMLPLSELVAEQAPVHVLDLPGFGQTPPPSGIWGTEEYARCLHDYLEQEQLRRPVLVGHSFGGKLALKFAAKYPHEVAALVLIAASGLKPQRPLRKKVRFAGISVLRAAVRTIERVTGWQVYRGWFVSKFASPDYRNAGPLRQTFVRVVNEDLTGCVSRITVPVLMLWGDEDTETPLEMARRLQALLRQAKLTVIPGRGHYPFLDSGLHLCAHYIRSFLSDLRHKEQEAGGPHE